MMYVENFDVYFSSYLMLGRPKYTIKLECIAIIRLRGFFYS